MDFWQLLAGAPSPSNGNPKYATAKNVMFRERDKGTKTVLSPFGLCEKGPSVFLGTLVLIFVIYWDDDALKKIPQ